MKNKFQPGITVNLDTASVNILLEDVECYAEWIPGEGADVALYRALPAPGRVVGALLPLRKWNGKFPVNVTGKYDL